MGITLSNEEKQPKANQFLVRSGEKARAGRNELEQFKKYQSMQDGAGTITSYKGNKRKSNYLATNESNPLVRTAQRGVRMLELARIARKRKQK